MSEVGTQRCLRSDAEAWRAFCVCFLMALLSQEVVPDDPLLVRVLPPTVLLQRNGPTTRFLDTPGYGPDLTEEDKKIFSDAVSKADAVMLLYRCPPLNNAAAQAATNSYIRDWLNKIRAVRSDETNRPK